MNRKSNLFFVFFYYILYFCNFQDIDRDHDSPANSPARPMSRCSNSEIFSNQIFKGERNASISSNQDHAKSAAAAAAAAQAHFNGTSEYISNFFVFTNLLHQY